MTTPRILLVDDDVDLLRGMSASLQAGGYRVLSARDGVSAMRAARQDLPDLIVLDLGLPAGNGFQVMEWLTSLNHQIPVIVVSGGQTDPNQALALEAGALAFFQKPVDRPAFMEAVRAAVHKSPGQSASDAGRPRVVPREMFLDDVVAEALAAARDRATAARVSCQVVIPPGLPPAFADPDRTREVIINLLDNAIKSTLPDGMVGVHVRFDREADALRVSVVDAGPRIAPEDRHRVFKPSLTPNSSDTSRFDVGLPACQQLVALQGGRIWVEPHTGPGATLSFTLPIFSLRALCSRILTPSHLAVGAMAVITVEVELDEQALDARVAKRAEVAQALDRCLVTGHGVVLPLMFGPRSTEPFFLIVSTDEAGAATIERTIYYRLAEEQAGSPKRRLPTVSVTMVRWPPHEAIDVDRTVAKVVDRLHELVTGAVAVLR